MTWKTGSSSHSWPIVRRSGGLSKQGPGGERRGRLTDLIRCEGLTALGMSGQSFLEPPWLSGPKSQPQAESSALRTRGVPSLRPRNLCSLRPADGACVTGGMPQLRPGLQSGFRVDPELGRESPATSDGDIWGLTWARATGRWGSGETSGSETNRQLIPELTPHLPGRQTTGSAHPQGQPHRFLPLRRRLSMLSTLSHRRGCKDTSRQFVAPHCTS